MYMKYDRIYPKHKNLLKSFLSENFLSILCQAQGLAWGPAWGLWIESSPLPPCSCTSGEDGNMNMCFDEARPWESGWMGGSPANNEGNSTEDKGLDVPLRHECRDHTFHYPSWDSAPFESYRASVGNHTAGTQAYWYWLGQTGCWNTGEKHARSPVSGFCSWLVGKWEKNRLGEFFPNWSEKI